MADIKLVCSNDLSALALTGLPEVDEDKVATAGREMLLNSMEHGGKFDPERRIEIAYLRARHVVLIRFKDPGRAFSLKKFSIQMRTIRTMILCSI